MKRERKRDNSSFTTLERDKTKEKKLEEKEITSAQSTHTQVDNIVDRQQKSGETAMKMCRTHYTVGTGNRFHRHTEERTRNDILRKY